MARPASTSRRKPSSSSPGSGLFSRSTSSSGAGFHQHHHSNMDHDPELARSGGDHHVAISEGPTAAAPESQWTRLSAALAYGACSALIMLANKLVLYTWKFPSPAVLALSQFVFTAVSMRALKRMDWITFPEVSLKSLSMVFPLPLLFLGNAVTGLSGTSALSIPMFTVLRRTTLLMTMALEFLVLKYTYSRVTVASVFVVVLGSVLAGISDLRFDGKGYAMVLINNFFTSSSGVVTKMKLTRHQDAGAVLSVWGLMYLNSVVASPILCVYFWFFEPDLVSETVNFEGWRDPYFVFLFVLSSAMGTLLQLSIFYCTKVNSALTTVVVGVLKNIATAYVGMISPALGYDFDLYNFLGINLSMLGGCVYGYVQFVESTGGSKSKVDPPQPHTEAAVSSPLKSAASAAMEELADADDEDETRVLMPPGGG